MSLMQGIAEVKSPEELKAEMEGKGSVERELKALDDPRLAVEYTFTIKWTDPRGKVWKGEFTNRRLDFNDHSKVGALRAQMAYGAPEESLDRYTKDHNEKVAHMTISLIKRPKWAADLGELDYIDLRDVMYLEVARHEAIFQGRRTAETFGAVGSEDAKGSDARVVAAEV